MYIDQLLLTAVKLKELTFSFCSAKKRIPWVTMEIKKLHYCWSFSGESNVSKLSHWTIIVILQKKKKKILIFAILWD